MLTKKIKRQTTKLRLKTGRGFVGLANFVKWAKILDIAYWVIFTILISAGAMVILSRFDTPLSYKFLTVQSGSMKPTIGQGAFITIKPQNQYDTGDVVTFMAPDESKIMVTHRIVAVEFLEAGQIQFVTKGDANEDTDTQKLPFSFILGKVIFAIPYFGYLIEFIRKPAGAIIFVVIPATIFVVTTLEEMKKEIVAIRKRRALT